MDDYDTLIDRAENRAIRLSRKYGVYLKDVLGAYGSSPLGKIEYLLHEVAHWMTIGHSISKLPRNLSNRVSGVFNGISTLSSNSLEIDTAMVTYLAGWLLGFWKDPGPIVNSCRRNLKGLDSLNLADDVVYKRMVNRWTVHRDEYGKAAIVLAKWFRPTAKLSPFPETEFP